MKRLRLLPPRGGGWLAVMAVIAATVTPARAAIKITPGQELIYSGTAELKVTNPAGQVQSISGPVQISALDTEADAAKGYSVILLRRFQPQPAAGQPNVPADVSVTTVRYGADLSESSGQEPATGPLSAVLQALRVPLSPRSELKSGDEWRQPETLPAMPPRPVEVSYTVAGSAKVGDRNCTSIQKKLAQALPYKQDLGGQTLELTDYGQTLCVDPDTGQILQNQLHEAAQVTAGPQKVSLELSATVTLQQTKQLSADVLASRVKEAAAVDRLRQAILTPQPNAAGMKKALGTADQEVAAFRRQFPDSPYAPAVARLDAMRRQIQAQVDIEGRLTGLKGAPAPAFTLKTLAGPEKTLAAYRGKIIILNFFANW